MMKIKILYLLALFVFNLPLFGQHLYICRSHTDEGQPIDADIVWDIRPFGQSIYILYDNGNQKITEPILYLLIDKQDGDEYHPFDSRAIHIETGKTWVTQNYSLKEAGEYEIYIMGANRERLATVRITVSIKNESNSSQNNFSNLYYDNSNLIFCQLVINNKPFNIRNTISMSDGGSTYVYIKSDHAFSTSKLLVNVWRKTEGSYDYDVFVESKKYKMQPDWQDVFFGYDFKSPGQYKISIYNEEELLIKFGFITVSQ